MQKVFKLIIDELKKAARSELKIYGGARSNGKSILLGYQKGLEDAVFIVNQTVKEYNNGWIPCSERLPDKEYELYWTTHEDGSIVLHGYTKKNGFIYNWEVDDLELRKRQGGVVAWMLIPMPEPYKEGK